MPDSDDSGIGRLLRDVERAGTGLAGGATDATTQTNRTGDQLGSTTDQVVEGLAGAAGGLRSANEAYRGLTGNDSGLLTGAGGLVGGVQQIAQPVIELARDLQADAGDLSNVTSAVGTLGTDIGTLGRDGQTTLRDTQDAGRAFDNLTSGPLTIGELIHAKDAVTKLVKDAKILVKDGERVVEDVKKVGKATETAYNNIVNRHTGAGATDQASLQSGATAEAAQALDAELPDAPAVHHDQYSVHFGTSLYDEPDSGLAEGDLFVTHMSGREEISQIYQFELTLLMRHTETLRFATIDRLLKGTASIWFGADREHRIYGVLRSIESVHEEENIAGQYRAVFVPRLWYLSQTLESTVYQHKNAVDILLDILKHHGMGEEGTDYEVRIAEWSDKPNQFYKKYPKHEYTVQFMETELNFVSRLLEHEGIYFFFEHGDGREKLVICDANAGINALEGHEIIRYRSTSGATVRGEHVSKLVRRKEVIPRKLHVRDFNYRTPSVNMRADAPVDEEIGTGEQFLYGEHFKSVGEGKKLAKIRAEEQRIKRAVFHGTSVVRGLRPGQRFTLDGHPQDEMDMDYVVTALTHSVEQSAEGAPADASRSGAYRNEFTAVPYEDKAPFRPARITPKPRIVGIMHARIDQLEGQADEIVAPIDEQGRYKLILPFNNEDGGVGKASRWVRLAEPYTGIQYGMHFPLHVGTEVLIEHIDGDPDRPVIMASVPNFETSSVVTNEDATRSRIVTRSNIRMVWRDRTRSE